MNPSVHRIALLPGDGIGIETMRQARRVLRVVSERFGFRLILDEHKVGGSAREEHGTVLPSRVLDECRRSDAILFGAVGGAPRGRVSLDRQSARGALLSLRRHFRLFSNLRPAVLYPELKQCSPLKNDRLRSSIDILCVRELTGGIYFGAPRGRRGHGPRECAFDTELYHRYEVERIARVAFRCARERRGKVTSIDKANVLESSALWREVVDGVADGYPDVALEHLYVDNALMQLVRRPGTFDVLLCSNLFGDLVSDLCASLIGSLGVLPSASLNEHRFGLYEPAGGSAPDIAGQGIANPVAQILSAALLCRHSLRQSSAACCIERSVREMFRMGHRTADLTRARTYLRTDEVGDVLVALIRGESRQ